MNLRTAAIGALALAGLAASGCDQPAPSCQIAQSLTTGGNYAATFTLEEDSVKGTPPDGATCPDADGNPQPCTCAEWTALPAVDVIYVGTFPTPEGEENCGAQGCLTEDQLKNPPRPNNDSIRVGIQPTGSSAALGPLQQAMGAGVEVMQDPDDVLYAWGGFNGSQPNGNDYCEIEDFDFAAQVSVPAIPAYTMMVPDPSDPTGMTMVPQDVPASAAAAYQWEFSNLQAYVTPQQPGTAWQADLTYTHDGCSATYKVVALFRAYNDSYTPTCSSTGNIFDPTSLTLDPSLCSSDLYNGFSATCDEATMYCVLSEFPGSN